MQYATESSPVNSRKELPKSHNIEARYSSYEKANDYIKHITKVFDSILHKSAEFDSSCIESLNFRSKLPLLNGKFKISSFPCSQVSKETLDRIALVNAYNNLADVKFVRSKFREKSSISPKAKIIKKNTERNEYFSFNEKIKAYVPGAVF